MPELPSDLVIQKYQGCLVGAAVGDALGAPIEFMSKRQIEAKYGGLLTEMVGGGVFGWRAGQTTDDTDQTLAIVDSLIERGGYDPFDISQRFLKWFLAVPKDVGTTTSKSLLLLKQGLSWQVSGKKAMEIFGAGAGNGSLMRTAPIGLYFRNLPEQIDKAASEVSAITHAHPDCIIAAQLTSQIIANLSSGSSKQQALEKVVDRLPKSLNSNSVLQTFDIALNAFLNADSFEQAVVESANTGGDCDTQATVTGALAGAFWGIDSIPKRWKQALNPTSAVDLESKAKKLFQLNRILV